MWYYIQLKRSWVQAVGYSQRSPPALFSTVWDVRCEAGEWNISSIPAASLGVGEPRRYWRLPNGGVSVLTQPSLFICCGADGTVDEHSHTYGDDTAGCCMVLPSWTPWGTIAYDLKDVHDYTLLREVCVCVCVSTVCFSLRDVGVCVEFVCAPLCM